MDGATTMTESDKKSTKFDFHGNVKIKQVKDGYHFTSDAIALADFIKCKSGDLVIDAGCGGGVLSLIIWDRCKPKKIVAVDIQPEVIQTVKENFALNSMQNAEVHCMDIREFHKAFGANLADVLVCNPPYFSNGRQSANTQKALSRHDESLTIEELATSATKLLKYSGSLYICYPSTLVAKAIGTLENNNFRIKHLKFIKNEKEVYLVLIHAKKGGGHFTSVSANW